MVGALGIVVVVSVTPCLCCCEHMSSARERERENSRNCLRTRHLNHPEKCPMTDPTRQLCSSTCLEWLRSDPSLRSFASPGCFASSRRLFPGPVVSFTKAPTLAHLHPDPRSPGSVAIPTRPVSESPATPRAEALPSFQVSLLFGANATRGWGFRRSFGSGNLGFAFSRTEENMGWVI